MIDLSAPERTLRVGIDVRWHNDSGVGAYVRNLTSSLFGIGERIEYVLYLHETQETFSGTGCESVRIRRVKIPKYSFQEQWFFPRVAADDQLDVFHIPFYVSPLRYVGKMVVTLYDVEQLLFRYCAPRWPGQAFIHLMMKLTVRRADRVIAISENTKRDLVDMLGVNPAKVESISIACSPVFMAGAPKSKFRDLAERFNIIRPFVVAYVGKQWRLKNTAAALLGFLHAKRQFNLPHQMVLVGRMGRDGEAFLNSEPMANIESRLSGRDLCRTRIWWRCIRLRMPSFSPRDTRALGFPRSKRWPAESGHRLPSRFAPRGIGRRRHLCGTRRRRTDCHGHC